MLGLRKTRPPLRTAQRLDLELLMRRTTEVTGKHFIRQSSVLTSVDELELPRQTSDEPLADVARVIQQRLPPIDAPLRFRLIEGTSPEQPAARYSPADEATAATISLTRETLGDPLRCVMELAYQLSAHFWHQLPEPSELDTHPRTTHLLPIACGMGVLASDASLYVHHWSNSGFSGWSMSRIGYYTAEEIGYAMALVARLCGESQPRWLSALRLDARQTAVRAIAYFHKHQQAGGKLLLDAPTVPSTQADPVELANWLRGDDPAFALAAGHALWQLPELAPLVTEATLQATQTSDPDLVPLAIRLLGKTRHNHEVVSQRLNRLAGSSSPLLRWSAIQAIEARGGSVHEFQRPIVKLINRHQADPIELAALVGRQGTAFASMAPSVARQLKASLQHGDTEAAEAWADCLRKIALDAKGMIKSVTPANEIGSRMLEMLEGTTTHKSP